MLGDGSCHLCTIGEGMIEEAESELDAQNSAHCFVNNSHGHSTCLDERGELSVVVVRHHVDVDAGGDSFLGGHGRIECNAMMRELHDGCVVGDNETVEAPLVAQDGL